MVPSILSFQKQKIRKTKNFFEKFGYVEKSVYLCGVKFCVLTHFLCLGVQLSVFCIKVSKMWLKMQIRGFNMVIGYGVV